MGKRNKDNKPHVRYVEVINTDFETGGWACICGNTVDNTGFYLSDENGNYLDRLGPRDIECYVCQTCGRIINLDTEEVIGRRSI